MGNEPVRPYNSFVRWDGEEIALDCLSHLWVRENWDQPWVFQRCFYSYEHTYPEIREILADVQKAANILSYEAKGIVEG